MDSSLTMPTILTPVNQIGNTATSETQVTANAADTGLTMAQATSDQFESQVATVDSAIDEIDAAIQNTQNEAEKQELQTKKTNLIAKKQELEVKQNELKAKINTLRDEAAAYRVQVQSQKSEVAALNNSKSGLQNTIKSETDAIKNKKESLEEVDRNIASAKADLDSTIASLHDSVEEMNKKSEDALKKQRTTIEAATTEALALCEAGQLKNEDMPSFIAGKLSGSDSTGDVSGITLVDAKNSKIKALCAQLSGYAAQKGKIQLSIKASTLKIDMTSPLIQSLNNQIDAKSAVMKASEAFIDNKVGEIDALNLEYNNNDAQLKNIDAETTQIDIKLSAMEVSQPAVDNTKDNNPANNHHSMNLFSMNRNTSGSVIAQMFGSGVSKPFANALQTDSMEKELSKIDEKYEEILNGDVQNTEIEGLRSEMSESDKLVLTLRNKLSDNAQKLIQERLEATKRR